MADKHLDSSQHTLLTLLVLYVAQSVPMAFFSTLLPIVLRQEAYSLTQIALLQLIKLPWILKFAWAPWVDRRTRDRRSLYRMIVTSEIVYAVLILILSVFSLEVQLIPILICMLLSFVASSVQDIAVDKYAILSLARQRRGLGNAMQTGGNFIGSLLGAGALVALYYYVGWQWVVVLLVFIVLLALIPLTRSMRFVERGGQIVSTGQKPQTRQPSSSNGFKSLIDCYRTLPSRFYILGLLLYFGPIMPLMVLIKPLLVDWQFDTQTVAMMLGLWGSGVAALASFVGGALIKHRSESFMLRLIYGCAFVVGGLYILVSCATPSLMLALFAIAALWAVYALASVVLYTLSMGRVREGHEGTDFTLHIITAQLGGMLLSAASGVVADILGYTGAFAWVSVLGVLLLFFSPMLLTSREHLGQDGKRTP